MGSLNGTYESGASQYKGWTVGWVKVKRIRWTVLYNALNAMKAKQLDAGKFSDGHGLWLHKRDKFRGKWFVRLVIHGRRREMGLGPYPDVSLAEARELAAKARQKVRAGVDPIEERASLRFKPKRMTVKDAIESCFKSRQAELKGEGKAGRWMSPLRNHVIGKIGNRPIEDLDQHVLRSTLEPIWHDKADTARKALNRLNLTLKHAAALGLDVDLQATMKARALLGKQRHVSKHVPSLPYQDAPAFYRFLCAKDARTALAMRFLILTVARSGEVRHARLDEIEGDIWTIPASRTKQGSEHRVPLSPEALEVLKIAKRSSVNGLVFSSQRGRPLADPMMSKFMKDNGYDARPHGFRATFRSWAEEQSEAEWEVKELSLGHTVGNKVERAYQRSDLIQKRSALLNHWSSFVTSAL